MDSKKSPTLKNVVKGFDYRITRCDLPDDFIFGASSASYQYEGCATEGGRGLSIWDSFSLNQPANIDDGSNGNVACNQYKLYKEDVKLLKRTGLSAYRFSISWPRVLPGGKLSAGINKEGIKYYNDLIDALLAEGIEPYVTLFHWDLPLALENEYGGFLGDDIVGDFVDYAELCFYEFGDRVKHWITINEAWTYTFKGYVRGAFPPGRGSSPPSQSVAAERIGYKHSWKSNNNNNNNNNKGDAGTEPYKVAHNFILAHANAVDLYRNKFQVYQDGEIGMTNNVNWYEPLDDGSKVDQEAAMRAVDFMFGWFVGPLVNGDYPQTMKDRVGDRLPKFDTQSAKLVKGSYDFLGINYYTTYYATIDDTPPPSKPTYDSDEQVKATGIGLNGELIGPKGGSDWLYIVPEGIYELLHYMKTYYGNPLIYITENGVDEKCNCHYTIKQAQDDQVRVDYHQDHLSYMNRAISEGANVKAYFLWSFFDNYEWTEGYTVRFGIFYIDFACGRLTRYPKRSAIWWTHFLNKKPQTIISAKRRPPVMGIGHETNHSSLKKMKFNNA